MGCWMCILWNPFIVSVVSRRQRTWPNT
jgi:hypothetical protein